ncbi:ABC transporter substrate-binding protein [Desulfocicer niacini]
MAMGIIFFIFISHTTLFAQEERSIIDMAGRRVIIHGEVKKIIPTFKPVTLCILSLGLQDRLVGVDTHSKKDKLTRTVFPGVTKLTGVGTKSTGINLETVLSLAPDLVILYAQKDGLYLAERLESMGISTIIILPESMDNIRRSLEIIAQAVGLPRRSSAAINAMDKVLSLVASRTEAIPLQNRKKAYFASSRGFFNTAAGNMLQDNILSRAGMINVSHGLTGYFQDISPEQFLNWNPDIVFLSRNLHGEGLTPLHNPALQRVSAINHEQIHRFPGSLAPWDFPSPLSALATLWASMQAYPERFNDIDLTAYANAFHQQLFNKTMVDMGGVLDDCLSEETSH